MRCELRDFPLLSSAAHIQIYSNELGQSRGISRDEDQMLSLRSRTAKSGEKERVKKKRKNRKGRAFSLKDTEIKSFYSGEWKTRWFISDLPDTGSEKEEREQPQKHPVFPFAWTQSQDKLGTMFMCNKKNKKYSTFKKKARLKIQAFLSLYSFYILHFHPQKGRTLKVLFA